MERREVEKRVFSCIERVAKEQSIPLKEIKFTDKVVENLGFQSLDVGTLTAFLEIEFSVDPFTSGQAVITEIRTVGDVCDLYFRCLNGETGKAADETSQADNERMKKRLKKRAS
jgi:acyl carrier protein